MSYYSTYKKQIWIGAAALLLIVICAVVFVKCGPDKPIPTIGKTDQRIKKEVQVIVDNKAVDSLEKVIDQISKEKADIQKKAIAASEKAKVLEGKIKAIIAEKKKDSSITYSDHTQDDYTADYIAANAIKDSLHTVALENCEHENAVKQITIKELKDQKQSLASSFNELSINAGLKDKVIKDLNKSLRWQKTQKIAGWAIAGAVLVKLLILK